MFKQRSKPQHRKSRTPTPTPTPSDGDANKTLTTSLEETDAPDNTTSPPNNGSGATTATSASEGESTSVQEGIGDNIAAENEGLSILEEVRERQRMRRKATGLKVVSKSGIPEAVLQEGKKARNREQEEAGKWGLHTAQEHSALNDTFTTQTNISEVDKKMLEFIEQEMRNRGFNKHQADSNPAQSKDGKPPNLTDDVLFQTPKHLQVEQKPQSDDQANRWLAGIEEVELPIEYRLQNIEDTETAKQRAIQDQRNRPRIDPTITALGTIRYFIPGQQRTDRHHRFDDTSSSQSSGGSASQQNQHKQQHPDSGRPNDDGSRKRPFDRRNMASDDMVYERFKKNYRFR